MVTPSNISNLHPWEVVRLLFYLVSLCAIERRQHTAWEPESLIPGVSSTHYFCFGDSLGSA